MSKLLNLIERSAEINKEVIEEEIKELIAEKTLSKELYILDSLNNEQSFKFLMKEINQMIEENKVIHIDDYKNKDKEFPEIIKKIDLSRKEALILLQVLLNEIINVQKLKNSLKGGVVRFESVNKPIPHNILDDKLIAYWNTYENLEFFRYDFKIEEGDACYEMWLHVLELEYILLAISKAKKSLNLNRKVTALSILEEIEIKVSEGLIKHKHIIRRFSSQSSLVDKIKILTNLQTH